MDEFDDVAAPVGRTATPPADAGTSMRKRVAIARAVSRVYRAANDRLRADMLRLLLRPLGVLGMAAVASGAFARLLRSDGGLPQLIATEDMSRYSGAQIRDLTLFVHEVDPDTLQLLAEQLSGNALGVTALGSAALVMLYRRSMRPPAGSQAAALPAPGPVPGQDGERGTSGGEMRQVGVAATPEPSEPARTSPPG